MPRVLYPYSIALRTRFRGITTRTGVVFRGAAGWAEWSPFLDYAGPELVPWLAAAEEAAELGWPAAVRDRIPVNCTVPAVGPDQAYELTRQSDCGTAKVKVAEPGQSLSDDLARVEAVRAALGTTGRLRIDANGGWELDQAVTALRALSRFDLEYAEQPCRSVEELAQLRRRLARVGLQVLIAADESIRRAADPYRVAELEAADVAVLKVQPLGGVRACLQIAERIGLPVVVSSALETSVGIRAGVALAAALPDLPYACGLNTVALLTDDLVAAPLVAVDGTLPVAPVEVLSAALDRCAADPATQRFWRTRRVETADLGAAALAAASRAAAASGAAAPGVFPGTPPVPACEPFVGRATLCARVVVEELLTRGIRDVVLAPGSRSAPLAYELFEADKIGLLTLHVRIDERSAGFLALGLAKATGCPVPVVTTSGTAVANLHPAVLEAAHSHVPLVVVSADRPRFLSGTGANQTTEQQHLFVAHVRAEAQLDDTGGGPHVWRFQLARLLSAATGERTSSPGPVHLNIAFSEPLSPGPEQVPSHPDLVLERLVDPAPPTALASGAQTVILAGDATPETGLRAAALAAHARLPLLAEPSSNARRGAEALSTYRVLLQSSLAEDIERVIVFGHPTLSRPVARLLQRDDVDLVVVSPYPDWTDPGTRATLVTPGVELAPDTDDWLAQWQQAEQTVREQLDELLAGQDVLTGPGLAGRLWTCLGAADTLVAGSSNPIRDLDLAPVTAEPATVYANRGLSGIDGTVSTAVGIALARERPTHALLGDLTLLHDSNGFIIGPAEPRPDLRIVVANDDGGSIFATLEHGLPAQMGAFERVFGTPHGVDLRLLAEATRATYRRIDRLDQVAEVLAEPPLGLELVEAVVDRRHRRTLGGEINALAKLL